MNNSFSRFWNNLSYDLKITHYIFWLIFGSGGIGIAGLGGAVGIWGGLAGTVGGILISSLIQNFEKKPH